MIRYLINLTVLVFISASGLSALAQVPLNWNLDEINPGQDVTIIPDANFHTEGLKSCHMQLHSGAVPYLKSDVYYVTPGSAYEFSFDVFDNDTAGQVKVYADFYDTYGFDVFGQPPVYSSDSSEWQTVSWTGTVQAQAVVGYVLVKFYCEPDLYHFTQTANIWIDNVRFSEAGGNNLVANGGFEEWFVGIDEPGDPDKTIIFYPNPTVDYINISLKEKSGYLQISDLTGREVLRINTGGQEQIKIDIQNLPAEVYFINVYYSNGLILRDKFIKR